MRASRRILVFGFERAQRLPPPPTAPRSNDAACRTPTPLDRRKSSSAVRNGAVTQQVLNVFDLQKSQHP